MRRTVFLGMVLAACAATAAAWGQRTPKGKLTLDRKLKETIVSFTFNEQPVHEAFDFLQTLGNVNIVIDQVHLKKPGQTLTLKLNNVPLETAVRLCAEQLGLEYALTNGVVFISDKATLRKLKEEERQFALRKAAEKAAALLASPRDRKVQQQLENTIVSFTFDEQPFTEAIDFLQTLGNVNIVIDRSQVKPKDMTVTLKLTNVPLKTAVKLCVEQLALRYTIRDGIVFISTPKTIAEQAWKKRQVYLNTTPTEADRKVHDRLTDTIVAFTFNEQPVLDALDFLQTLGGVNIVPDAGVQVDGRPATLKLMNVPLLTALDLLAEQFGYAWGIHNGVVQFSRGKAWKNRRVFYADEPTEADRKTLATLRATTVSLSFRGKSPRDAIKILLEKSNIKTFAHSESTAKGRDISLKLKDVPLSDAWTYVTESAGLRWYIIGGKILILRADQADR